MIRFDASGKVFATGSPMGVANELADALDIAVAALRDIEESAPKEWRVAARDALRQIGALHCGR